MPVCRLHVARIDLLDLKPAKYTDLTYIVEDCILEVQYAPRRLIDFIKGLSQKDRSTGGLEHFCQECESLCIKGFPYVVSGPMEYPINVHENWPADKRPYIKFTKVLFVLSEKVSGYGHLRNL